MPERSVLSLSSAREKREIRKMCEAVGLEVIRLKRTAIGAVKLGMLRSESGGAHERGLTGLRAIAKKGRPPPTKENGERRQAKASFRKSDPPIRKGPRRNLRPAGGALFLSSRKRRTLDG
jgi:23S rRNA pseudouridine2605 synthase